MIAGVGPGRGCVFTASFVGDEAVFTARGEVDLLNAPGLAGVLDAVIDWGYRDVVFDLAELEFLDAAGVEVMAGVVRRLGPSGGALTLRSPPPIVRRILAVAGLDNVVRMEELKRGDGHLGAEQSTTSLSTAVGGEPGAVPPGGRRVTAIPAADDVVDGALRLVVALARATVGGADGVSVSLQRHGRLATVAASDQTISDMDADQYATGEGPCVDASVEGRWFHVESLDEETRWPAFIPRAQRLGINAILSSPLRAGDRPVGALNIYSRTAGAFTVKDQQLASVFATETSIILADAGVDVADEQLSDRLAEARRGRQIIAQAQGVIMERENLDEDDAYSRLRRFSQRSGRPLRERAEDVVASTQGRRRSELAPERTRSHHV